jgi:hypothetical protein
MDEANREDGEEDTSSNMIICIRCTQHKPVTFFAKPGRKELLKTLVVLVLITWTIALRTFPDSSHH